MCLILMRWDVIWQEMERDQCSLGTLWGFVAPSNKISNFENVSRSTRISLFVKSPMMTFCIGPARKSVYFINFYELIVVSFYYFTQLNIKFKSIKNKTLHKSFTFSHRMRTSWVGKKRQYFLLWEKKLKCFEPDCNKIKYIKLLKIKLRGK